ncbi:hypothetical protein F9L67_12795 [Brucella melitensis]|nr:hypothetical protein F9L67_12795 [Brucella melitensis]
MREENWSRSLYRLQRFRLNRNVLTICFVALCYASKRNQKSVQWTDFPAYVLRTFGSKML